MFVKVHKTFGKNTGSCADLAEYMEKEADVEGKEDLAFFSHQEDKIQKDTVVSEIDNNVQGIAAKDDKFYMLTINPSQSELKHMVGRDVDSYENLTDGEKKKLENYLQEYTRDVMNIYAQNFERKGISNGSDLVYFARIETEREFRHYDREVEEGKYRPGDKKPGLNYHVHVIVSRKSKDGKTKLSPHAKSRGNEWTLNGKTAKRGFDHERFKISSQEKFNQMFSYKPKPHETYLSKASDIVAQKTGQQAKKMITKPLKDNFKEEMKFVQTVAKGVLFLKNPLLASVLEVKKQLNEINPLKGKD